MWAQPLRSARRNMWYRMYRLPEAVWAHGTTLTEFVESKFASKLSYRTCGFKSQLSTCVCQHIQEFARVKEERAGPERTRHDTNRGDFGGVVHQRRHCVHEASCADFCSTHRWQWSFAKRFHIGRWGRDAIMTSRAMQIPPALYPSVTGYHWSSCNIAALWLCILSRVLMILCEILMLYLRDIKLVSVRYDNECVLVSVQYANACIIR